ncbi:hypothetical protein B0H10DRAFT_2367070 [Mycena sp. CBHHK59/15]|nr:hypothetical protein B0H10DRAFT_2367070 [Mycena sp. CBHHK59/15]
MFLLRCVAIRPSVAILLFRAAPHDTACCLNVLPKSWTIPLAWAHIDFPSNTKSHPKQWCVGWVHWTSGKAQFTQAVASLASWPRRQRHQRQTCSFTDVRSKHNDFSARYCVIRDATMFLYWDKDYFSTRVYGGYYEQELPPLKTYRRTSAHDRFIPLTAVKSTVPINRPNEHPQLLVATANHTFTLVFTNIPGSEARVPPRNLSTSIKISSDPAANGGFASVYKGTWDDAVKVIRKQGGMDRTKLNKSNERKTKRVENVAKGGCEVVELRPIRSTIARSTGW